MSLSDDLDNFFENSDELLIAQPISFKAKLGIGEQAYRTLRSREQLTTFSETIGIGATASSIAATSTVASTFFGSTASSGFVAGALGKIGIGTAVATTPVGWVIAAGVISGGVYYGISSLLETPKKNGFVVIPKYINTPLDVIALALVELMLPVSLKVAAADGEICDSERKHIQGFFVNEWGYSEGFITRVTADYEKKLDGVSYTALAQSLVEYCSESQDCDKAHILSGFMAHLYALIESDGKVHEQELLQLQLISEQIARHAEDAGFGKRAREAIAATTTQASALLNESTKAIGDSADHVSRHIATASSAVIQSGKQAWQTASRSLYRNENHRLSGDEDSS